MSSGRRSPRHRALDQGTIGKLQVLLLDEIAVRAQGRGITAANTLALACDVRVGMAARAALQLVNREPRV